MDQLKWCIVTQIAFVWLSPLCVLNAFSNRLAVNMHGHSCTICLVFKCILKLLAWTDANSHSLHLFTLHHYVFWNCSDISGAPCYHCNFGFICPSHLKYHMKRIATKEKVLSLFISRLVRAWRCRALMWVFISIQIDPVLYFHKIFSSSCSYGLSPDIDLCWDFKWCQMKHTTQRRKVVQLDRICLDIDCLKIDVQ